jgi:aminomuconate-semialdehyde/2-hydroxymuconate-6-semialdehyde dehydrogenase
MEKIKNYINGSFCDAKNGEWLDNYNPSNGQVYSVLANSDAEDVEAAYQAAREAFPSWSNTTLDHRSALLLRMAELIDENQKRLALAEAKDNGKPLSLANTVDIPRASANFRFFAKAITQFSSEAHDSVGLNTMNFTLRQPLGVVGCISPWNLPLYLFTWKIAPALAAGNTVVAKPSEVTPMTASLLGEIASQAGLPSGVLNIVQGTGPKVGQAIVEHPHIKAVSFTGGTQTGAQIARTAAPLFKKLSLELGGKNPNIIFSDCDYEAMLTTTLRSSFANQGQICLCGSRIYVEESLYESFKSDFLKKVSNLKVGDPFKDDTQLGALVSKAHLEKVKSYIDNAIAEGGTLLFGGQTVSVPGLEHGYYLQPTVIEVSNNQCAIQQEEVFGPVVTLMKFSSEAEALQLANDTPYGLSATLWTRDIDRAMRFSKQLQTGIVWVNTWLNRDLRTPFGGTKQSGVGREGGWEALRFFTEAKNVCIQYK